MIGSVAAVPGLAAAALREPGLLAALARTVEALGWGQEHADALAALISHESAWRSTARNPVSGAAGLIQIMPATAAGLGTSAAAVLAMTGAEQLAGPVRDYFRPVAARLEPRDVPIAAFYPAAIGTSDEHVIADGGAIYEQNLGLDSDGDGAIRTGEVRRAVLHLIDDAPGRLTIAATNNAPSIDPSRPPPPGAGAILLGALFVATIAAWRLA